jgi:hypothetical protein
MHGTLVGLDGSTAELQEGARQLLFFGERKSA